MMRVETLHVVHGEEEIELAGEQMHLVVEPRLKRNNGYFFQAEDGIRDYKVTGVQTCALPIYCGARNPCLPCCASRDRLSRFWRRTCARACRPPCCSCWADICCRRYSASGTYRSFQIGRASCRERV